MRANVEGYLDWYYSLPGEWTRLAHLLTGNIEEHLRSRLSEQLSAGEPFATFEQEFEQAATAGISGVVAAAATRQVILRLATRGTLRTAATAATALARLTLIRKGSSGGGAAGGAFLGGAIGSVVPGIGTAIGAALGGSIGGLAIGAGAEYLILKLEERFSREGHRQQLLASIDEAEAEVRQQFGLEGQ